MQSTDRPEVHGIFHSDLLAAQVTAILDAKGFHVHRWDSQSIPWLPPGIGPIVIEADVWPRGGAAPLLSLRCTDLGPWIRLSGLGRSPTSGVVVLSSTGSVMPGAGQELEREVRWGWVEAVGRRAGAALRRQAGQGCVSAAGRALFRRRPRSASSVPGGGDEERTGDPESATLALLAREIALSEGHLSRLAKGQGIQLGRISDAWRMLLAGCVRAEERTWEATAWRLGYANTSGLSELALRTLGTRLRELPREPGAILALTEALLMEIVSVSSIEEGCGADASH